jgi:hypothetical protein
MNAQVIGRVKLKRVNDRSRSNTMVLARYYAKQAVQEQWKRQGLKPHHIVASQLNLAADAYLDQHREELFQRACAALTTFAQKRKG